MKLSHLQTFVAVAEAGGLAPAARRLGRTTSALSMTLKQFEEEVGGPLFEGERKGRLTPLGANVCRVAARLVAQHAAAVSDITAFARGKAGKVRVAAIPAGAAMIATEALRRVRLERPEVVFELLGGDSVTVIRAVTDRHADLGLATLDIPAPGLETEALSLVRGVVVCPPDRALDAPVRPETLAQQDLIAYVPFVQRNGGPKTALDHAFARAPVQVHTVDTALACVRAGLGVAVLPEPSVETLAPDLTVLPLADPEPIWELHLIARAGETPSPAVAAFVAAVRARHDPPGLSAI